MKTATARVAAVVAAAAVVLPGCATTSTTPPEEKAQATVEVFLESCAQEQPLAAMGTLTEPMRALFVEAGSGIEGCRTVAEGLIPDDLPDVYVPDAFARSRVTKLVIGDQFATAHVESIEGHRSEFEVETSGDIWLLSNPQRPTE